MGLAGNIVLCIFTTFKGSGNCWLSSTKLIEAVKVSGMINFQQVLGIYMVAQSRKAQWVLTEGRDMAWTHLLAALEGEHAWRCCAVWLRYLQPLAISSQPTAPWAQPLLSPELLGMCGNLTQAAHLLSLAAKSASPTVHPSPALPAPGTAPLCSLWSSPVTHSVKTGIVFGKWVCSLVRFLI